MFAPTSPAFADRRVDELLAAVSRTFYFSLRVLPAAVRSQISIAYLVARAADTVADGAAIAPHQRLALLGAIKDAVQGKLPATALSTSLRAESLTAATALERRTLEALGPCIETIAAWAPGDRERTVEVLVTLVGGMERDVLRFPPGHAGTPVALPSLETFDQHLYDAAGCVGAYWTRMVAAHCPSAPGFAEPALVARAVHLGKALQLVNVIRDLGTDLAAGRCYVPLPLLRRHGLEASELATASPDRVAPLLAELRAMTLGHVDAAWPWVLAIPASALRLRLSCIWPLWIALGTLAAAADLSAPLARAARPRITRAALYATLAEAAAAATLNPLLERAHRRRRARAAVGLLDQTGGARERPAGTRAWG